jgi:hypothetical protein
MLSKYELNLARLAQLVVDVNTGSVSPDEITEENVETAKFLANPKIVALAASVAMSTLGASVWLSGSHAPSADSKESHARAAFALHAHVEILVQQVKSHDLSLNAGS